MPHDLRIATEGYDARDDMGTRCRLAVILLVVWSGSAAAQEPLPWTVDYTASSGGSSLIATTFAELRPLESISHALTLRCGSGGRRVQISSAGALPWQTSARDPRESYVPVEISTDGRRATPAALLRDTDDTGQLVTIMRVRRGEFESPGLDELVRQGSWFDQAWETAKRVIIRGLAADPVEFRFDTLADVQRQRVRRVCFEPDAVRLAQRAVETKCRQEARGRVRHELEEELFEAKREWCATTRDARRTQLRTAFLRGVAAARNGGTRLAAAFAEFIANNPDVIAADGSGATQSCPDPHFQIDVARLRPVLERLAPGGTMSPDVADRHLAELLKEPGVVVKTSQVTFDPPQPRMDTKVWNDAIYEAERKCVDGQIQGR